MDNSVNQVLLLFKTHLDVGYTDYAKQVIQNYTKNYIPSAIRLARSLKESGRSERFVWTVGSWLIEHYFEVSNPSDCAELEQAIYDGDISYHAMPFTTHTELMDADLFQYGLSITKKLDAKFNRHTIAGKYTDVPGHTKAIIPHMQKNGIQLLHIGVNPASTPPDVPDFFVWRYDDDNEIAVIYNKGYYGEAARIPGADTVIHFAHTNDNCGPQSIEDVLQVYKDVRAEYPNAKIIATDLNGMAEAVLKIKDTLPVVTEEIGDTWIHGAGTDPRKVNGYRALLRLCAHLTEQERENVYKHLILVPEHTWGMCEMLHLNDDVTYTKQALKSMLPSEKYQNFMASWQEQRQYVTDASEALQKAEKHSALSEYRKEMPNFNDYEKLQVSDQIEIGNYTVSFDSSGTISNIILDGNSIFEGNIEFGKFQYEVFGSEDFARFQDQYLTNKFDWALEDYGKIGCGTVLNKGKMYNSSLAAIYRRGSELVAELTMPEEAYMVYGCPRKVFISYIFENNKIEIDVSWYEKDANRLGEAIWFTVDAAHSGCSVRKLGKWIDTNNVVSNGGRALHASDFGVRLYTKSENIIEIESLDTALVAPGVPSLLDFTNKLPDFSHGVSFNLYNNIWGTNFPMWYDEDARFRFILAF